MADPSADPNQNKGLLIAALVGVNILCLVAALSAGPLLRKPGAAGAATAEGTAAASATPTAEAKATAEPKPAAEAKGDAKEGDTKAADTKAAAASAEPAATAAPSAAASAAADAPKAAGGTGTRATISPPRSGQKGVVRAKPEPRSALVASLPAGTAVEVTDKSTINKQDWYEIKTVDFTPAATGWVHSSVLKME